MSLILSSLYNLKTNIASIKVANKYNSYSTFSIKPALQMGEMDSELEALEIPLLGDYEVHHLLRKKISDIVAVSNPTPSLQQRRSIKQAATIQILELKSTTIKLVPLLQRGVEWAQ